MREEDGRDETKEKRDEPKESKQLALHLVDLTKLEQSLPNNLPALVRVGVVHGDLAREHERGEEEAVRGSRSAASGGVTLLQAGEEEKGLVGDGDGKTSAVEGVSLSNGRRKMSGGKKTESSEKRRTMNSPS